MNVYRVSIKNVPLIFLNNSVQHWLILIILACNIRKKLVTLV